MTLLQAIMLLFTLVMVGYMGVDIRGDIPDGQSPVPWCVYLLMIAVALANYAVIGRI